MTDEPVVFVIRDEPKFEFRATLHALECQDETGWDRLGSDEPMVMIIGMSPEIPPGTESELIKRIEDMVGTYKGSDYDSGERKVEDKLLSTVRDLTLDSRVEYLVVLMEDDSRYAEFLAGVALIVAAALIAYIFLPAALAVVSGAGAIGIWGFVYSYMEEDEMLGKVNLEATSLIMDERIGADHAADFLLRLEQNSSCRFTCAATIDFSCARNSKLLPRSTASAI